MDKRHINLEIEYSSLCEFFNGMNEEEVYELQLGLPYKMLDKEICFVEMVAGEFDYMLNEVEVLPKETKFRFYSTSEIKEMDIDLLEGNYERKEIEYMNNDVNITYNGMCEFYSNLYKEEFEGIEMDVPYVVTVGEAEIIYTVACEYNYEVVDLWNEGSSTYIILEYSGEDFGEDLSIESVTTGFDDER